MLIQIQLYNAMSKNDKDTFILGIIMTQYSFKRRLKDLRSRGGDSVKKDLSRMHAMHTFILQDPRKITRDMKTIYCFIDDLKGKNKWRRKGQSM